MKEVCAWCDALIKDGEGETTHGICPPCRKQHFPNVPIEKEAAELLEEVEEEEAPPRDYYHNQHAADVRPSQGW